MTYSQLYEDNIRLMQYVQYLETRLSYVESKYDREFGASVDKCRSGDNHVSICRGLAECYNSVESDFEIDYKLAIYLVWQRSRYDPTLLSCYGQYVRNLISVSRFILDDGYECLLSSKGLTIARILSSK